MTKAVLEIKAPFGLRNEVSPQFKTAEEQPHYLAQMQLQMACTGADECHFFQWSKHESSLEIVKRDPDWLAAHLPALKSFMDEYWSIIASDEAMAPYLEPLERDMSEDDLWAAHAQEYREIDAEMKSLKKRQDAIKKALIKMADNRKAKGCGLSVYPTTRQGSVDTDALAKAAGLSADDYRKEPTTSWTVRVGKEAA